MDIPIVTYEQRDGAGVIDCISFGSTTASSVQEAILSMDGDTSVWIMDLRSNPGGDSRSTAASVSLFTGGGIMLYFRDGDGTHYRDLLPRYTKMTDKPVIVLTGPHSASGSELFAGDIRAYEAGIALGQRTFGKGIAQLVFDTSNAEGFAEGEALKSPPTASTPRTAQPITWWASSPP